MAIAIEKKLCKDCGKALSMYNPEAVCFACDRKKRGLGSEGKGRTPKGIGQNGGRKRGPSRFSNLYG